MKTQTVIFDFDGTIADSLETVITIYRELTGDDRPLTRVEIDELRKLPVNKLIKAVGVPLWRVPALLTRGRRLMHGHLKDVTIFPGLPEVIKQLHDSGVVLHIVSSNSKANVEEFLSRHDMRQYFSEIHGSIGLFQKTKTLKSIMLRYRLDPKATWYVGDEARDVTASRKAGIAVVSVTWGYQHRDLLEKMNAQHLADTPQQLLETVSS